MNSKPKRKQKLVDPLETLAADPQEILKLLLWKMRFQNQGLTCLINDTDLKAYGDCIAYLKAVAEVRIERDPGRPASKSMAAIAPRPFVSVSIVEKGSRNALRPVENNEKDYEYSETLRTAKSEAQRLSNALINDLNTNSSSASTIQEAAALMVRMAEIVGGR